MDELNQKLLEEWENADLTNNFIFCKVMQNEALCRELIERLLNIKIDHIEYLNQEQVIDNSLEAKAVRLDVYIKGSNKVFDIEMQTTINTDLAKRTRYYQSMMDMDLLSKGMKYSELKDSYILFICTDDPFGENLPVYTFSNICNEKKKLKLNDGTHKIFYNASAYQTEKDKNVRDFLEFLHTGKAESDFTERLKTIVNEVKSSKIWREYMTLEMHMQEREYRCRKEGEHKAKLDFARTMLIEKEPIDKICKYTGLSIEEINKIQI